MYCLSHSLYQQQPISYTSYSTLCQKPRQEERFNLLVQGRVLVYVSHLYHIANLSVSQFFSYSLPNLKFHTLSYPKTSACSCIKFGEAYPKTSGHTHIKIGGCMILGEAEQITLNKINLWVSIVRLCCLISVHYSKIFFLYFNALFIVFI